MTVRTAELELGDEIGRGALGRVVRVHRKDAGEVLAGKVLHPSHQSDAKSLARFEGEGGIAADLRHPNVARVYGIAEVAGERVLLMELVEGPSLAEVLAREGPLGRDRLLTIARGIAAGLSAAHRAGLVHRDLKPQNVLLAGGELPKLVDFGLARAASFEGVDPSSFAVVGTPDYIAPESIDPLAVDPRSDLYSFGCMLYEMATGAPPFSGGTAFAVLEAHRRAAVPELAPGEERPAGLVELVRSLLAKSPADRPQSAHVVERTLADLERSAGAPPGAALARTGGGGELDRPEGRCASCGDRLVAAIPVCFACGLEQATLTPGRSALFVVGPGETGDKLASELRQRLLDWLRDSPALGLDPSPLARKVPRLPFPVVTRVSEGSATRLARSLDALGFSCRVERGGRFSLPEMRHKAWTLAGRLGGIIAVSGIYFWQHFLTYGPLAASAAGAAVGGGWYLAGRRVTARAKVSAAGLPRELEAPIDRVAGVLPALGHRRHREGLRAVVERALALREAAPARLGEGLEGDLARILDQATVAASRVDELESRLAEADLREPDRETRAAMRERDLHAARLLELAALLDALRVRLAAVAAPGGGAGHDADELDELRAYVEALEEVEEVSGW